MCVELSHFVNIAKRARDQCYILVQFNNFCPDYGLLLELHALTQVAILT